MDREEVQRARIIVVAAIETASNCFRPDISKAANGRVSEQALSAAIKELLAERVIRMRECPYEHDWEYLLAPQPPQQEGG
jgi:predicted transcriptional regulator